MTKPDALMSDKNWKAECQRQVDKCDHSDAAFDSGDWCPSCGAVMVRRNGYYSWTLDF